MKEHVVVALSCGTDNPNRSTRAIHLATIAHKEGKRTTLFLLDEGVYIAKPTAETLPRTPDAAQGSWTLIANSQTVIDGTWAATKRAGAWAGSWSARVRSTGASPGPTFSGTWQAAVRDFNGKTLAEMLRRAVEAKVSGTWRSAGRSGTWSLQGQ